MKQIFVFFIFLGLCASYACKQGGAEDPTDGRISMSQPTPQKDESESSINEDSYSGFEAMVQNFEDKDRVIWQKPDVVIKMLGDLRGKKVADIGAGTGYFAFRLVPTAKKVIAIDIDPNMIAFMDSVRHKLSEEAVNRFDTRLAKPNDPLLQPDEVDAVVIVNTYGYLEDRKAYLSVVRKGIKPGGRILIIDFKKNHLPIGPDDEFKVSAQQVIKELQEVGFQLKTLDTSTLDYQYVILAEKVEKE